jgi:hypothetical protein
MTQLSADVQGRLLEGYREQLRLYDQAVALVKTQEGGSDWLHQLHDLLSETAALDTAMADDKEQYRQLGVPAQALTALLEVVASRLVFLQENIAGATQRLQAKHDQMLPQIDELIQRRRMLAAYGKYGDRQSHVA